MKLKTLVYIFLAVFCAACSAHENTEISGLGWIRINLKVEVEHEAQVNAPFRLTLTDLDGGYSHTWADVSEFKQFESYQVGEYEARIVSGTEYDEGYDCPCYIGSTKFQVHEAQQVDVTVTGALSQAIWSINCSDSFNQTFPDAAIVAHSKAFRYINIVKDADSPLLLMPGPTYFYVTLHNDRGDEVSIIPSLIINTAAANSYALDININDDQELEFVCGDQRSVITVNENLFTSAQPTVTTYGFTSGEQVNLTEGYPSPDQLIMEATADAGLESVILTIYSTPNNLIPYQAEFDLMNNCPELEQRGLLVTRTEDMLTADFSGLLENLNIVQNIEVNVMMQARDKLHRVSEVATLKVSMMSMEMDILSQKPAIIGENQAEIMIQASANLIEQKDISVWMTDNFGNEMKELPIDYYSIYDAANQLTIRFHVDPGVNSVPVVVKYMGLPKLTTTIERKVPDFSIGVDPMAQSALVMVDAENEEVSQAILQYITVYANGELASISKRLPEKNMLWITGLEASHAYTITGVVIPGQTQALAKITTESATAIPMGDFEDAEEIIKYNDLPSGGKYSTASFPIYNQQNYEQVRVWWPTKSWASVNAKTFCRNAKNQNTWYLQPSSVIDFDEYVSGSKSIRISTVGWSLDGEEIPPYMQKEDEFLPYNNNVPYVEHTSAGKLFLGTYSFDPVSCTERYNEGISFSSRPTSLNGFYKYEPDVNQPDDQGVVAIELINENGSEPLTVAKATLQFSASPSFIAFNLPLEYNMIGVRPTRLKVMFSSTINYGDIEAEDIKAVASSHVKEGCYRGSTLWIDNLSFSY